MPWHHNPDSKVHGANMGPTWGWQDPGGPHVSPMDLAIWEITHKLTTCIVQANNKNIKALHDWPCVRGIHRWSVDSPHKGPVMQKAFTYHYTMMTTGFPSQMSWNMESVSIIMIDRFPTQRASNLDSIYIFMTSSCSNFSETCLWSCPSHWPTPSPRSPPLPAAPPAPCPSGAPTHR